MARREAIGGIDFASVEHDIEGLLPPSAMSANTPRGLTVHAEHAAMAQVLGAADEPGNFLGLNAVKLAQKTLNQRAAVMT